jgi:hypothetical protein
MLTGRSAAVNTFRRARAYPTVRIRRVLVQPALVTGVNSVIIKATAVNLARDGADVVLSYVTDMLT